MQSVSTWGSDVCGSAIVCFQVRFLHILPLCTSVWLQGTHWVFLAVIVTYIRNSSRPVLPGNPLGFLGYISKFMAFLNDICSA